MDYEMLVNRENPLSKTYIPDGLVDSCSKYKNNILVNKTLLENFNRMRDDAKLFGYSIDIMSGYRDYLYQEEIYNRLVLEKGMAYAFRSIAPAGCSEHQTGLAIDICIYKDDKCYIEHDVDNTLELKWLIDNCYKYGFILRYPKDCEDKTGYNYEPWHYRYVGKIAPYLYKNKLLLEDYHRQKQF
jgi:D-alanyl-D-alanine carboxypeptidase